MSNDRKDKAGRKKAAPVDPDTAKGSAPGLYVHVPFCRTKCPYCDFYSITDQSGRAEWLEAVATEAARFRGVFGTFDTLYIGGGTPSLLSEPEIERLFEIVTGAFGFAPDTEITIEANPDDVTALKLAAWCDLGVNRVSLGIQSFEDAELRFLRRRHDAAQAERSIALARAAGFENVGLDLMYGFEGQSLASWERTLERALGLSPEHLSCYQMTIDPGTELGRMLEAGTITAADEETQRSFFMKTAEILRSRGYIHYEISNFARGERHVSRHNHKYWIHAPYIGLGPAAHSFDGAARWWNVRSVEEYCGLLARSGTAVEGREVLTGNDLALEALYLGLRTREGVPLEALHSYGGWRSALDTLLAESLVTVENGRVIPTLEGFCLADRIALAFAEREPGAHMRGSGPGARA
jgi:putative oxygen-independent coproporphyrinogen III oxidase